MKVSSPHRYCRNACDDEIVSGILVAFQALIGTVETLEDPARPHPRLTVSSPHRYCRNDGVLARVEFEYLVSSPHRYCRNARVARIEIEGREGFKPS